MPNPSFHSKGLQAGIWTGTLHTSKPPARLQLVHDGRRVAPASVAAAGAGQWDVVIAVPPDVLSDGVSTLLLIGDDGGIDEQPAPGAVTLGRLSLIAGKVVEEDLRAEVDLLRAEIDLLKREFRRLAIDD